MLLVLLQSVWNLLLVVLTNPLFLLVALGTLVLFGLSKIIKGTGAPGMPTNLSTNLSWAQIAWFYWAGVLGQILADFKADPLAYIVLAFVASVNLTIGLIAVGAYFVVRKIGLKL